jgi:hypothetical protein
MLKSEQDPSELFKAVSIYIPKEENCFVKMFQYLWYYCSCRYLYKD